MSAMQCRECGFSVETQALFCPNCGVRLAAPESSPLHPPSGSYQAVQAKDAVPWQETVPQPKPMAKPQAAAPKVVAESPAVGAARPGKPVLLQAGEVFAGRYRIEKFLGQGSLCNSYLCRDSSVGNREAVLKVMHARKASEAGLADSFLFLAESVSKYESKGIAKTYEWGTREGAPYYTMEWVSGVPLRMWLLERLTFENRVLPGLSILRALLDVFEAIHERGCYGSLKPENVFVTLSGPVVTDFGVVGFLSPQEFEFNAYARRYLPYMAPELRQDWSNLIPHSDYYSLGAILYEILIGKPPAPQLRLPSEMSELFGLDADEIILKAMAPKPLDRFGTLEAFRNAVESLQASLLHAHVPDPRLPGGMPMEGLPGASDTGALPVSPAAIEGGVPVDHVRPEIANDARTVHDPDVSFSTPRTGTPVTKPDDEAASEVSWRGAPTEAPSGEAPERNPYSRFDALDGDKTLVMPDRNDRVAGPSNGGETSGSLGVEAAHAQRRFSRPIIPPMPERPAGEADGAVASGTAGEDALSGANSRAWESLTGKPPKPDAEAAESVPAWLWISLALAGCCMVVISAWFGLLLPR